MSELGRSGRGTFLGVGGEEETINKDDANPCAAARAELYRLFSLPRDFLFHVASS